MPVEPPIPSTTPAPDTPMPDAPGPEAPPQPSQPGQPDTAPPEINPPTPDIDVPAPNPGGMPGGDPIQPVA